MLDLGIYIQGITFQDVHPPLAVVDAYRDVSRAESDRRRRTNEAAAYRAEKLTEAEARATATVNIAQADHDRSLALAASQADVFAYQLAARDQAPALTDFRLFWEAVASVMADKPKLILDASSGRPQRLILPRSRAGAGGFSDDPRAATSHDEQEISGELHTMKTRRAVVWIIGLSGLAILVSLGYCCLLAVDETEYAVVTSFGRVVAVHGMTPGTAGLHFKLPWESVLRVDQRLRAFDPPPREVITGDKRNLEVAAYLIYRVADPVQFVRGSGSLEQAEARLSERVSAALSDAIGRARSGDAGHDRSSADVARAR